METITAINPRIKALSDLAYRAHCGTSFSPEKRRDQIIKDYSEELIEDLETVNKHGGDVSRYEDKYISLLTAWLRAKSNCISSMITGPSNFPVRRAEKANQSEHNRSVEFSEWRKKALHAITKPENTTIVKGTDSAIDQMRAKLETLERNQETMKAINKLIRDKKTSEVEKIRIMVEEHKIQEQTAIKFMDPNQFGGPGFPSFSLTNNNAKITRLKEDITAEVKRMEKYTTGNKEYEIKGVKVVENAEENRLQLSFDGKPAPEVIERLKKNGYRWSPKNATWQRQLTQNALYSLRFVLI